MSRWYSVGAAGLAAVAVLAGAAPLAAQEKTGPNEWLQDMASVITTMDYQGTVIRRQQGSSEALKITHKIIDGVVHEKLVSQEGNGLEIIRFGNEVHCILPDSKQVLIEQWNNQSTLFHSLPSSETRFGAQYDVRMVRQDRVAGRPAMLLAVRPHDQYRFGHRLWLDRETAFPLRTELVDSDGTVIEQIKFAEVQLGQSIPASELRPSFDLDTFTWYAQPARGQSVAIETEWVADDLPPGFRVISVNSEDLPGAETPATHIVYSDGLATVSVFVGETNDEVVEKHSSVGSSSAYTIANGDFQITAIGVVPERTVQQIASSMRRQRR
ncbi:MAG: MucB/RseB C-terminal domain-containing protein [Gammaproteobacteria bacterium]|nr:MAG: MucB/RseB C-terminal domain-containing protein [Gammaproteobacteria bacterium]